MKARISLLLCIIVPILCEWDFVGLWNGEKKPEETKQEKEEIVEPKPELLTSGAFENYYIPMLNDKKRNSAFRIAIEKAVKNGSIVLDIGAGQGLLSMMAARAGICLFSR